MNKLILFLLFVTVYTAFCDTYKDASDDFKCSLPEVMTVDDNLDIGRFRSDFTKISEVKFPGLIGPTNERLICKIKCIEGNWVGPLCSQTSVGLIPDGHFEPVFRECLFRNRNPLMAYTIKNNSILMDTYFPHGAVVMARCKHFGLYKLTGNNLLRCENGEWSAKQPQCIPTSVITNYTDDSPPTIQFIATKGSAIVEFSGDLYVYPGSNIWLDCLWPKSSGKPDWSWTQSNTHFAGWASRTGETELYYRLVLSHVTAQDSGAYTCTSPAGSTNTVTLKVVNIVCPPINVTSPHVHQFAQGSRLGNAVHFSCQPGYQLNGSGVVNCMGDGRWSSLPPTCIKTFCPALRAVGALTVLEHDAALGGRAVFACAWGYRLVGAPGLECEPDGRWSGEVPTCAPIYCPDPLVPEKGRLLTLSSKESKYPVGYLIIYSCEEGYEILGESSIVCTENGFWSHPPPFCLPPSEIKKSDTIYIDNTTLVNFED